MAALAGFDRITLAQAVVCYLGVVLYGGILSVAGRRPGLSGFIVFFYAGLFPLPEDTLAFLVQEVLLGLALAAFGAHILGLHLQSLREVRAMEAGRPASPLPARLVLLLYGPPVVIVGALTVPSVLAALSNGAPPPPRRRPCTGWRTSA